MITVEEATRAGEEYIGQAQALLAWQTAVNEEWEQAPVHQQRETAYNELTRNVLFGGGEEGAMHQFLSYTVRESERLLRDGSKLSDLDGRVRLAAKLCG
jgi:hypothetical protein